MIGRQVIITNRAFTLEELFVFMGKYWDTEEYAPLKALESVLRDIRNFAGAAEQFDDITMLGITYRRDPGE